MDKDKLIDSIVMRELENIMILNMPSNDLNNYIENERTKEEKAQEICNTLKDNYTFSPEDYDKSFKKIESYLKEHPEKNEKRVLEIIEEAKKLEEMEQKILKQSSNKHQKSH